MYSLSSYTHLYCILYYTIAHKITNCIHVSYKAGFNFSTIKQSVALDRTIMILTKHTYTTYIKGYPTGKNLLFYMYVNGLPKLA